MTHAVTVSQWCRQLLGTGARAPSTFNISTSLRSKSDSQLTIQVLCSLRDLPISSDKQHLSYDGCLSGGVNPLMGLKPNPLRPIFLQCVDTVG